MSPRRRRAFTLVEILVVIAIIGVLAAILFPAFATARERSRSTACLSNLKQIGAAMAMYGADYDGRFPYAVDQFDKVEATGTLFPNNFDALVASLPLVHETLVPYSSRQVFQCAGDRGFEFDERTGRRMDALPTCWEKYGSSYYYRTELVFTQESSLSEPAKFNVMFDATGRWHAVGLLRPEERFNTLFADGHVKSLSGTQYDQAWKVPAN